MYLVGLEHWNLTGFILLFFVLYNLLQTTMNDSEGTLTSVVQNNKNSSSPDSPPPLRRSIDGIFFKFLPEKS